MTRMYPTMNASTPAVRRAPRYTSKRSSSETITRFFACVASRSANMASMRAEAPMPEDAASSDAPEAVSETIVVFCVISPRPFS